MDWEQISSLFSGNTFIWAVVLYLLFQNEGWAFLKKLFPAITPPGTPPVQVPMPSTPPPAEPVKPDSRLIDIIKDLVPVILPLLVKASKEEATKQE